MIPQVAASETGEGQTPPNGGGLRDYNVAWIADRRISVETGTIDGDSPVF